MSSALRKLNHSLRISIDDVRLGMFISELDRPWVNSPFMLQGFLLTEPLDLKTLQSLSREIVIDPSRSAVSSLSHLPWELLHAPSHSSAKESAPAPKLAISTHNPYAKKPEIATDARRIAKAKADAEAKVKAASAINSTALGSETKASLGRVAQKLLDVFDLSSDEPKPYYLRHAETKVEPHEAESKASRSARLTPPSNPEFSNWIQSLYPRDVIFAPLNWMERVAHWWEERRKTQTLPRGRNIRPRPLGARRPDYIPDNIRLVTYVNASTVSEELVHARNVADQTSLILKKLESDIQVDQSIAVEQISPAVNLLTLSVTSNPAAMMWLIRLRSENVAAYSHSLKVAIYMMVLGRHLGFPPTQLSELGYIGLLLDVGKLELPEGLLDTPNRLNESELEIMRTHVDGSVKILQNTEPLAPNVLKGIMEHHERLDGSGYPHGLTGNQISIFGRIAAIADSFAAMTSPRTYGVTHSPFDAMKELFKEAGTRLHAPLVEEFVQAIGIFPVGSMIELSTGEVAIVLEHNKIRRLEPKVLLLTKVDKALQEKPYIIDLMTQKASESGELRKILRGLPDGAYGLACQDFYKT
jgi:HD-GYP domain-containing protein (c-di-GMP phosphodiesterase class II)